MRPIKHLAPRCTPLRSRDVFAQASIPPDMALHRFTEAIFRFRYEFRQGAHPSAGFRCRVKTARNTARVAKKLW